MILFMYSYVASASVLLMYTLFNSVLFETSYSLEYVMVLVFIDHMRNLFKACMDITNI